MQVRPCPLNELKGNSTVKTSWVQIKDNTFNKFFPKYLGQNHFSKGEIVRQIREFFKFRRHVVLFRADANRISGRICDVIACIDTFFLALLVFLYYSS